MFKPLQDNVLIEIIKETKTASGIYLPEDSRKTGGLVGVVIAVGPGRILDNGQIDKPDINVGDKVIVQQYVGNEIVIDSKEYLLVTSNYVLGKYGE